LTACFGLAAFLVGRSFTALRAGGLAVLARFACGRDDFGFAACFAGFADARFAVVRDVDRRKPFVRLLLIWGT
jgi:hypothetical protein